MSDTRHPSPPSSESPARTVFCATAYVAQSPFVDGARVDDTDLGCYTTLDAALAWIHSRPFRKMFHPSDTSERLLLVRVMERALDVGPWDYRAHVTLSPQGVLLERKVRGDRDKPWEGRDPSSCRWKRGDIAACVYGGRYRIGVVLAPPPSFEWVRKHEGLGVTWMDDVYLLGFPGDDLEHDHSSEAKMLEPLEKVPEDLLLRLKERLSKYEAYE